MKEEEGRREYFRIDDRLPVEFRRVSPEEFLRLESVIRHSPSHGPDLTGEDDFPDVCAPQAKAAEREHLYAYLRTLDRKLDMIIDLLAARKGDSPYKALYTDVNISGSGIKFASDERVDASDRVELRITLPTAPCSKISVLCEVVRVEELRVDEAKMWQIALRFLVINEHDRDFLINYIFVREREKLRSERKDG